MVMSCTYVQDIDSTSRTASVFVPLFFVCVDADVSCFIFLLTIDAVLVSCLMFHISCFMFHVSCFMFRVSCFMFHSSHSVVTIQNLSISREPSIPSAKPLTVSCANSKITFPQADA